MRRVTLSRFTCCGCGKVVDFEENGFIENVSLPRGWLAIRCDIVMKDMTSGSETKGLLDLEACSIKCAMKHLDGELTQLEADSLPSE